MWILGPFDFAEGELVEMEWAAADGSVHRQFTSPPLTPDMLDEGSAGYAAHVEMTERSPL